jgi:hypothetical protein
MSGACWAKDLLPHAYRMSSLEQLSASFGLWPAVRHKIERSGEEGGYRGFVFSLLHSPILAFLITDGILHVVNAV